jgi:hypothetical protein
LLAGAIVAGRGAVLLDMTDRELLEEVRRLRSDGASPRAIARMLGVRPAVVASLVRRVAAERPVVPFGSGELAGCWVSPGWSRELLVVRRDGWDDVDLDANGPAGMALVLVARATRHDRVSVCGFLLDTFCLGVKSVIGPEEMRRRDLPTFARMYFVAFPVPPLAAPIALTQMPASALGFSPDPDFEAARGHLGQLDEPCAIGFGQEGRPLYVAGPCTVGSDGFAVAA